jgi:endoglucanase
MVAAATGGGLAEADGGEDNNSNALRSRLAPVGRTTDDIKKNWAQFKGKFLQPDGRIIDTGNGGVSHSEGQAWGLLFSESSDDKESFDKILAWTRQALGRRSDSLTSWRYRPNSPNPVQDLNNATDGDLFMAWALARAAERWSVTAYANLSQSIARSIISMLVHEHNGASVLLPGASGFVHRDRINLNPSYYAFPAIKALSVAYPHQSWSKLERSGLELLRKAVFGRANLTPDWVAASRFKPDSLEIALEWPPRFSYDAIRVPLYLAWARLDEEPALHSVRKLWFGSQQSFVPAWVDLRNDSFSPYLAPPGIRAVAKLVQKMDDPTVLTPQDLPPLSESSDYYSAALTMLTMISAFHNS